MSEKKYLVIGLGSMGKRRIRCLLSLGIEPSSIFGFDMRDDRKSEAKELYDISLLNEIDELMPKEQPTVLISVPPDVHHIYMKKCVEYQCHYFVEASVLDTDLEQIIEGSKEIVAAPSSTLYFHPAIQMIKEIVSSEEFGKPANFVYHSGQYLPDWHSYEKVSEYYVSQRETGGGREIVPFELTWITNVFGFPKSVVGNHKKTIHIEGAENIDDTYSAILDWGNFIGSLTVDVVSRMATRRLNLNFEKGMIIWDWDSDYITVCNENGDVEKRHYKKDKSNSAYNKNISEQMYVDEINCFLNKIKDRSSHYPNTLEKDLSVLHLLYKIEKSAKDSAR